MEDNLIYTSNELKEDNIMNLRPKYFREYIGQKKIIDNLKVYVKAAKKRGESLDHCLIYGPPGLGKTTLANVISAELNSNIKITSGPVIEKPGDLAAILTNIAEGDVLFIDEIHRLHPSVEEILYPAIEDFKLDLVIGQGPAARTIRIDLNRFTLIGATTRIGLITSPLRDRFGITLRLEFYETKDLVDIIINNAKYLNTPIDKDAAIEIAKRSRGTPRVANRILRRMRDFAEVFGEGRIALDIVKNGLSKLEIDHEGFNKFDILYLESVLKKFKGGPVGIETISATLSEEKETIEDVIEPYLLYKGFIKKTPRGRIITDLARIHLGEIKHINKSSSIEDYLESDVEG
jgi:Holliday junction DNA helicase RuvB